jgi:hypothetical protein
MIRNRKKISTGLPPPFVCTGCKKGGGTANPLRFYVQSRTFHSSPSPRHHMLSSTVADTNLQLISNTKLVPPGMIDNGGVYEFPDDISDLDGMAKILQPNTITSGSSSQFDEFYHSHPSSLTKPSFVTSEFTSPPPDWYGPSCCVCVNDEKLLLLPPDLSLPLLPVSSSVCLLHDRSLSCAPALDSISELGDCDCCVCVNDEKLLSLPPDLSLPLLPVSSSICLLHDRSLSCAPALDSISELGDCDCCVCGNDEKLLSLPEVVASSLFVADNGNVRSCDCDCWGVISSWYEAHESYVTEGRCTYLRLSHISYHIARMCAR